MTDPTTLLQKNPPTFTIVEADASPEATALVVLDMKTPGNAVVYRQPPSQLVATSWPSLERTLFPPGQRAWVDAVRSLQREIRPIITSRRSG